MTRPMIGVVPLYDSARESDWMLPGYMDGLMKAGGLPVMLPLTEDVAVLELLAERCDGFLFTGGQDVSPALYGAAALPECGEVCPTRDAMEMFLLKYAIAMDKPLLGICRGIQFLNAALGGTLYQDLPMQRPSPVEHHQSPPYDAPVHSVTLLPGTPLHDLLRCDTLRVNSYHHQAVRTLAPQLLEMACSEDGLTEAVCCPEKHFLWAVQWHPEFSFRTDPASRKIFRRFVAAMCEGTRGELHG